MSKYPYHIRISEEAYDMLTKRRNEQNDFIIAEFVRNLVIAHKNLELLCLVNS